MRIGALTMSAIVALAGTLVPAVAGLQDCERIATVGYKIVFDDIVGIGEGSAPDANVRLLNDRLRTLLRELIAVGEPGEQRIDVVQCPKRFPEDDTDFTDAIVQGLNDRDVLIEMWALLAKEPDDAGRSVHTARLSYLVVPVRVHADGRQSSFHRAEHRIDGAATDVLALFRKAEELRALSRIGIGAKSASLDKYETAIRHLCKGATLLEQAADEEQGAIVTFARNLARATVAEARLRPDANPWLRSLPEGVDVCALGVR